MNSQLQQTANVRLLAYLNESINFIIVFSWFVQIRSNGNETSVGNREQNESTDHDEGADDSFIVVNNGCVTVANWCYGLNTPVKGHNVCIHVRIVFKWLFKIINPCSNSTSTNNLSLNYPNTTCSMSSNDKYRSKKQQSLECRILDSHILIHVLENLPLLFH